MSKTSPIPHPEWRILQQKSEALKSQIAAVLTDLHSLHDARPVVIGRYAAAFADRLFRLHELEIGAARLKREAELVQACINTGREIDYEENASPPPKRCATNAATGSTNSSTTERHE